MHGMNAIAEGVWQLRGASVNPVPDVEDVLVTACTGVPTSGDPRLAPLCSARHEALVYLRTKSSSPNVSAYCIPLTSRPKNVHCLGPDCGPLTSLTV